MKIDVKRVLKGLENEPLIDATDKKPYTVGRALTTGLLGGQKQGDDPYKKDEHVARYMLAMEIQRALSVPEGEDSTVDISSERASSLQEDIRRHFGPIMAGPLMLILDGREVP